MVQPQNLFFFLHEDYTVKEEGEEAKKETMTQSQDLFLSFVERAFSTLMELLASL